MITIIFETHATSLDNEARLSSGHDNVELSPLGEQQAEQLGKRYSNQDFEAIFCSDLQRSYKTAEIAFGDKFPIIKDARLRECDYGDLTKHPNSEVESQLVTHITIPFPNGESYQQTSERMKSFLDDLKKNYDGKKVMITGHRATRFGLEHWINGVPLETLTQTPFKWQPGWIYQLS